MIVKKLKELYNVDTLSQDKGWKKVQQAIEGIEEDIMIDFSSTNVIDPWQCSEFKQLLRKSNVHMRFVNEESIVNRIKMMCIIDGLDASRIENVVVEIPKEKTAEEKKIESYGNLLIPLFNIDENNVAVFNAKDKYDQLQSTNTVNYIDFAIREIHKVQSINKFIIRLNQISVLTNVTRVFAKLIVDYQEIGIELTIDTDNDDIAKDLGLFIHLATNEKYTVQAREDKFRALAPNTAGMLIRYKKSKATDDFGRQGKGEVVSSRIAIFKGIKEGTEGDAVAVIDTYNSNYFYTKQHWMVEHDNEELDKLECDTVEIPMEEIGLCDLFLGSRTHFIMPVQRASEENQIVIVDVDEEGRNIKQMCTIPERMKIVFDDWGIKYDVESLNKAINETKTNLGVTA